MDDERAIEIYCAETGNDISSAISAIKNDFLTVAKGRDGQDYAWYMDESAQFAIGETRRRLNNEEIEELLV